MNINVSASPEFNSNLEQYFKCEIQILSPFFQSKSVFEDMQQHADSYLLSLTIGGTGNFHMQICWA